MRLILATFDALLTFDRAATRREIEREGGLTKDEVRKGLCGLARRGCLIKEVVPCRGGVYRLTPGCARPEDVRGRFERSVEYRAKLRQAYLKHVAARGPAPQGGIAIGYGNAQAAHPVCSSGAPIPAWHCSSPPAPSNAPGALRVIVRGVLDLETADRPQKMGSACVLAELWKVR